MGIQNTGRLIDDNETHHLVTTMVKKAGPRTEAARGAGSKAWSALKGLVQAPLQSTGKHIGKGVKKEMAPMVEEALKKVPRIAGESGAAAAKGALGQLGATAGAVGRSAAAGGAIGGVTGGLTQAHTEDPREIAGGVLRGALGGLVGGAAGRGFGAVPGAIGAGIGGIAGSVAPKILAEKEVVASEWSSNMPNRFAGVTVDFYDDLGGTLSSLFPSRDELPDVIKTASVLPKESLPNEQFALVMVDQGHAFRKFACNDAGTASMSAIYFMEHGDKLPIEAQKTAAENISRALVSHGIQPPEAMLKLSMDPNPGMFNDMALAAAGGIVARHVGKKVLKKVKEKKESKEKKSNVIDITGHLPPTKVKTAAPESDDDYAVVMSDGSRYYPIHSWDLIKTAELYYQDEQRRMHPEIRHQFATKLAAKADLIGYPIDASIVEGGSQTYANTGHMRAALEMRKVACEPGEAREFLDGLLEKRAEIEPTTYAEVLRRFDVEQGIDHGWDHLMLDPWQSTFGIDKTAEVVWEEGADRVTDRALLNLAENHLDLVTNEFTYTMADGFKKDPIDVFKSLPTPLKKLLARMAMDSESVGGAEHEFVG